MNNKTKTKRKCVCLSGWFKEPWSEIYNAFSLNIPNCVISCLENNCCYIFSCLCLIETKNPCSFCFPICFILWNFLFLFLFLFLACNLWDWRVFYTCWVACFVFRSEEIFAIISQVNSKCSSCCVGSFFAAFPFVFFSCWQLTLFCFFVLLCVVLFCFILFYTDIDFVFCLMVRHNAIVKAFKLSLDVWGFIAQKKKRKSIDFGWSNFDT